MRPATLRFLWSESWAGIRKNALMTLAAVSTVAVCLALSALFMILVQNINFISWILESEIELVAYLEDDFNRDLGRDYLVGQIGAIAGVDTVLYVTREEALEDLRRQFGDEQHLLDAVAGDNPLRDAVRIVVTDTDRLDAIASRVSGMASIDEVRYERELISRLLAFTDVARAGGMGLVVVLAAATFLIVSNTVRLTVFARREEIEIMKLVGATPWFIRMPFIIEGLVVGVSGAVVALAVTWYGYTLVLSRLALSLPFVPMLSVRPLMDIVAGLLLGTGAFLGIISSAFAVRRFLSLAAEGD